MKNQKKKKKVKTRFDPWEFVTESLLFPIRVRENLPSIWKGHTGFNWRVAKSV